MKSFLEWRKDLARTPEVGNSGCRYNKLLKESLITVSQRQRLEKSVRTIKDPELKNLSRAVLQYLRRQLDKPSDIEKSIALWRNITRETLADKLYHKLWISSHNDAPARIKLIKDIDKVILKQQILRIRVMVQYMQLSKNLEAIES